MVFEKPYEKDTSEDIKQVFNEIDSDMKGFIDADDLRNMAS
jgi:Ca2+-binding EF-hand superfamily protein